MTIEQHVLTYLKGKDWVAGGTLEREVGITAAKKPGTINRTLRLIAKNLDTDFTRLPHRAVSYRHRCSERCGDFISPKDGTEYHGFKAAYDDKKLGYQAWKKFMEKELANQQADESKLSQSEGESTGGLDSVPPPYKRPRSKGVQAEGFWERGEQGGHMERTRRTF